MFVYIYICIHMYFSFCLAQRAEVDLFFLHLHFTSKLHNLLYVLILNYVIKLE